MKKSPYLKGGGLGVIANGLTIFPEGNGDFLSLTQRGKN